ncbi:hepatic lectin-like isoform 2-T4 [Fundulus diaphanus]
MSVADATSTNGTSALSESQDVQQTRWNKRSKLSPDQLVLVVLISLLAAAVFALGVNETCLKCGAGWELQGGNCYNFSTMRSSWNESRRSCKDLGGDLVKIDSREEQMFLFGRLRDIMEDDLEDMFWIGLTDSEEEGRWLWVDGSPLNSSLSFWFDGQPDNKSLDGAAEADCVRMGKIGGADFLKSWFDISCNYPQKSICEKAAETGQCSCVYG